MCVFLYLCREEILSIVSVLSVESVLHNPQSKVRINMIISCLPWLKGDITFTACSFSFFTASHLESTLNMCNTCCNLVNLKNKIHSSFVYCRVFFIGLDFFRISSNNWCNRKILHLSFYTLTLEHQNVWQMANNFSICQWPENSLTINYTMNVSYTMNVCLIPEGDGSRSKEEVCV